MASTLAIRIRVMSVNVLDNGQHSGHQLSILMVSLQSMPARWPINSPNH